MRVIGGAAKGRKLKSPKSPGTRPIIDRVKTALFDILSGQVADATFLDLFGGVGGVGIEALSRGASHATFVELDPGVAAILTENLRHTGLLDRATVMRDDAFKFLERATSSGQRFDLIYVAPPQYHGLAARALAAIDAGRLTAPDGQAIVQVHPKERVDFTELQLHHLALADERKYGSTLLLFYTTSSEGQA